MKFKGISEVIATLLMLIIAIALASTAYLYVSGYFRSSVSKPVIDPGSSYCDTNNISVVVKNPGVDDIHNVKVDVYDPSGSHVGGKTINLIKASLTNTTSIPRGSFKDPGYYRVVVSSDYGGDTSSIWCPEGS